MKRKKKPKTFLVGFWGRLGMQMDFCGPFDDAFDADEWASYHTEYGRFDGFIEVKSPKHFTGE